MFFNLFGSDKEKYIEEYAQKLCEAAINDEMDADFMESLIAYAKEKGLDSKQLGKAQALACDKAFESLYHEGYMDDDEYGLFSDMLKFCYMIKEKEKYKYTTIARRCNALYKIQEEGLMPQMNREYANVDYREGERLHFTASARLMKADRPVKRGEAVVIAAGKPFKVGGWKNREDKGSWKEEEKGAFWMTSERLGFRSREKKITTELVNLESVEMGRGSFCVYEKGKEEPWCVALDDYEMAGALLSNLMNRQ